MSSQTFRLVHIRNNLLVPNKPNVKEITCKAELIFLPLSKTTNFISINCVEESIKIEKIEIKYKNEVFTSIQWEYELIEQYELWKDKICNSTQLYRLKLHEEEDIKSNGNVIIFLPKKIKENLSITPENQQQEPISICINYKTTGLIHHRNFIYTKFAQGAGYASLWLPCYDQIHYRFTYEFNITVAKDLMVICSGTLHNLITYDDQPYIHTFQYSSDIALSAYSIGIVIGKFKRYISPNCPYIINYYQTDESELASEPIANGLANGPIEKHSAIDHQVKHMKYLNKLLDQHVDELFKNRIYNSKSLISTKPYYIQVFLNHNFIQSMSFANFSIFSIKKH